MVDMKTVNPRLKVMLAVGGWSHGVERFSAMVSSDQNIEEFATNVVGILRKYKFDGLDLDWEFPAYGKSSKGDKFRFTRLIQILRQRFDEAGVLTRRETLLLSAAVSAVRVIIDDGYEVDIISNVLYEDVTRPYKSPIFRVCENIKKGWTRVWNEEHQVPYAYHGNQWVGYDDIQSFASKANFIREMRLAGSMVWSMDLDDFTNVCGQGVNPLMSILREKLERQTVGPITDAPLPTVTDSITTPGLTTRVTSDLPPGTSAIKRVCYFTNWAQYRASPMTFTAENLDPFLCTHIVYAFAQLDGNTIATVEWNDLALYQRVMNWKGTNTNLKLMLAVGGFTHGVQRFSDMASSDQNIETFTANAILFLRRHGFDGLDLDWEYPAYDTSDPGDKLRFTRLMEILRREFDLEGISTKRPPLELAIAVSASKEIIDAAYEIDIISQHVDFMNLMSYDFHGVWDNTTGHNSPLYARQDETADQKLLNQNAAVQYWISRGAPPHKLVMGLALYGRSFTLASPTNVELGAAITGGGTPGEYTGEVGYLGYYEVVNKGWTRVWNEEHKVPYAYSGDQWVGYDDVESFIVKANYILTRGLGGSIVWAMDLDDFNNVCGLGVNPLMSVLRTLLNSSIVVTKEIPTIAPPSARSTTGNAVSYPQAKSTLPTQKETYSLTTTKRTEEKKEEEEGREIK
ncbi:chitotriosidase-1-like [Ylistrum balloti]|uniref:chitotriosidase-1-like n=1 Tax=Ylistrum balloti TaxID=509963 RepID=UPI0029057D7F|nr:chitotriosidase-1-like [Ylistrum balloti]